MCFALDICMRGRAAACSQLSHIPYEQHSKHTYRKAHIIGKKIIIFKYIICTVRNWQTAIGMGRNIPCGWGRGERGSRRGIYTRICGMMQTAKRTRAKRACGLHYSDYLCPIVLHIHARTSHLCVCVWMGGIVLAQHKTTKRKQPLVGASE